MISSYAQITAPLHKINKKITWGVEAEKAFMMLKYAMMKPVVRLPHLSKEFIVKSDAGNLGTGKFCYKKIMMEGMWWNIFLEHLIKLNEITQ